MALTLKINGTDHTVDVDGEMPLLWVLRDVLGMTGTPAPCIWTERRCVLVRPWRPTPSVSA
jgi:aerobic-type carbon monoxide dehydrogenase small subunit (CoxS/CutS family)